MLRSVVTRCGGVFPAVNVCSCNVESGCSVVCEGGRFRQTADNEQYKTLRGSNFSHPSNM